MIIDYISVDADDFIDYLNKKYNDDTKSFDYIFVNNIRTSSDELTLFGRELKVTVDLVFRTITGNEDYYDIENEDLEAYIIIEMNEENYTHCYGNDINCSIEIPFYHNIFPCKIHLGK